MPLLKKKFTRGFIIALFVFAVALTMYYLNVFHFLELKTYDKLIRSTATQSSPSEEIIVVVLDQSSLDWAKKEKGWSWPWPREAYGDIAKFFSFGGTHSVAYDILYTEPSAYSDADDEKFAKLVKECGNVIFALQFGEQYGDVEYWHDGISPPNTTMEGYSKSFIEKAIPSEPALFPIDIIAKAASGFGYVSSITDSDGIIRRGKLFTLLENIPVPFLGLAGLSINTEKPLNFSLNEKKMNVSFANKTIQVDNDNSVYLRYRSNIESYAPYFAREILESYYAIEKGEQPLLNPNEFKDKYVFFGFYAPGLFDIAPTPIDTKYPGVGVHITILDNFLQNDFINLPAKWLPILLLLISSFAGVCIVHGFEQIKKSQRTILILSLLCILLFCGIYITIATLIFIWKYWIPFIAPIITAFLAFFVSVLVNYNLEGKQKRYLKIAFKQYLSPTVIEQIIADPEMLKLGGDRKEISMFFSDLQGFTSISEKITPEELTNVLNKYLTAMSDIILESGGTIDKYVGDAIVAFWNAPINQDDHPFRALNAAMKCQDKLFQMQEELTAISGVPIKMRIGLNTGFAVVGNMGSKNRFNYSMLGDSVNLAARLEGMNKQFGTYTMCTKNFKEKSELFGKPFFMRELARVAVVGKQNAVTVFEPMSEESYTKKKKVLPHFDTARNLFYEGNFKKALEFFQVIEKFDEPSKFYAQKCQDMLKIYPDGNANFDGVWIATSK